MPIARLGKVEQRLQQAVDRRRSKQVPSTHDIGHALNCVIDHHRQMVARRQIASAEDNVAPNLRRRRMPCGNDALAIFGPPQMGRSGVDGAPHVEPEGGLVAAGHSVARLGGGERATRSGIERRAVRVVLARGSARDLRAAAKARVDKVLPVKLRQRRLVVVAMLALPARRRGKAKPEPGKVIDNGGNELRLAARPVQIFNAQQHASVAFGGDALIDERGVGVAEMKRSIWRRREAEDGGGREDFIGHGDEANT